MEYHGVLRFIERGSSLWSGAGMAGDMETIPARSKVPVGKRTQRLLVGAPYHFSWVGLLYVRLPSKTDRST